MYHSGMTKFLLLYLVEVKEMRMLHWYRIMFCWYHIIFIFLLQWNRHILKVSEDWNTSGCCVYRKVRLFFLRDCFLFSASTCRQTFATLGWMYSIIWRTFFLLDSFIPFGVKGKVLEPIPTAPSSPEWVPSLLQGPISVFVQGYLSGALIAATEHLPCFVRTGAWTKSPCSQSATDWATIASYKELFK